MSYFLFYTVLKKKYDNKQKPSKIKILIIIIINILIKHLTGFSKKIIINSFKSSLILKEWSN
jgi:hypothetical protein